MAAVNSLGFEGEERSYAWGTTTTSFWSGRC